MELALTVNGRAIQLDIPPTTLLSDLLREILGLTGTHIGCDTSQCGACVVHVNGRSVKSCTVLAVAPGGCGGAVDRRPGRHSIRGRTPPDADRISRKPRPAMRLLHPRHDHERGRVRDAEPGPHRGAGPRRLEGNLCRCTGYQNIVASVLAGAEAMHTATQEV